MGLQDKLRERMLPTLEPGEQIIQVFPAQTGVNPNWLLLTLWAAVSAKPYVIAVTDRGIVRARTGLWTATKPKTDPQNVTRFAHQPFGAQKGLLYSKIELDGQKHYVHRRFRQSVNDAHGTMAALATRTPAAPQMPAPDPHAPPPPTAM